MLQYLLNQTKFCEQGLKNVEKFFNNVITLIMINTYSNTIIFLLQDYRNIPANKQCHNMVEMLETIGLLKYWKYLQFLYNFINILFGLKF